MLIDFINTQNEPAASPHGSAPFPSPYWSSPPPSSAALPASPSPAAFVQLHRNRQLLHFALSGLLRQVLRRIVFGDFGAVRKSTPPSASASLWTSAFQLYLRERLLLLFSPGHFSTVFERF
ncbi:hypothetical protein L596_009147 [Steinernema carpocapsae]|uniref:Uncharacterized protein n=1 Tax=Steinernema carpocapsae TaxID=34508 RepID=A0A4U5PEI1_STECR|nr:hypothetical protein L596_009147 [Steinernema carpocapsae]